MPLIFIFLLEIIFSFHLGFYNEGIVILDRKKIKTHYINGKLKFDIITLLFFVLSIILHKSWVALPFLVREKQV